MIVRISNDLTINAPKTFLSVGKTSGVGTINVKNTSQFTAGWAVQIGQTGEERSEIKIGGTVSGTSIVLSANTTFEHPSDTPVFSIKYDQVVFEKSSVGTAGTATPITDGTISITPDSQYTQFDDSTGSTADAYKVYFRNSSNGDVSAESDWLITSGFTFFSLAKIRQRAMNKLFNSGFIQDDDQVNDWINEWLEEMTNAIIDVDKSYSLGTANVAFGTSGLGTISESDYKHLKRVWVTYDGVNKYRATRMDLAETHPNEIFTSAHPYYVWQGDNVFQVKPEETGGTAEITYYKRPAILTNDTDEIPQAMRSYTKSFVNYALAQAYYYDDKDTKGDRFLASANGDKNLFIKEMTPRNFTGVETIEMNNIVYGEEDDLLQF